MSDRTYNGWSNYETWAVGMFLDGNYDGEGTYLAAQDLIRSAYDDAPECSQVSDGIWSVDEARRFNLAEAFKEFVEESLPEVGGIAQDLLRAGFDEVNWAELAGNHLSELGVSAS